MVVGSLLIFALGPPLNTSKMEQRASESNGSGPVHSLHSRKDTANRHGLDLSWCRANLRGKNSFHDCTNWWEIWTTCGEKKKTIVGGTKMRQVSNQHETKQSSSIERPTYIAKNIKYHVVQTHWSTCPRVPLARQLLLAKLSFPHLVAHQPGKLFYTYIDGYICWWVDRFTLQLAMAVFSFHFFFDRRFLFFAMISS